MTHSPVAEARTLLAADRPDDAIALVTTAGDAGNVDALMLLANWRMVGQPVARDLPQARALLARAVAIGHVDAALMEVALTANGSGGTADWQRALGLLRIAARNDPLAAAHLALLDAMAIDGEGRPNRPIHGRQTSESPAVTRFPALLSADECRHIASVSQDLLEPAAVIDPATGQQITHPVRTSSGAVIGPAREDLVIRALNHRIARISNTDIDQGEPLSVLHYAPGQQYRPHHDALPATANQRIKTVLVYLNEGFGGGETRFIANGLTIRASAGDAILFDNVTSEGKIDPRARHAGLPVTRGSKWLATRWIRERPYNPWTDYGT